MANSNNWGEIYKSTWWGDKAWSANTLFIDSAPPGFGLNLLKASEDMDNTLDWITRTGASVSAQNTNDPNGELTAERVDFAADVNSRIQQLVTLEASTTYTFSVHAKVPSGSQDFRLKALGVTGVGSFTALSSDWTRFDFDFTTTTAGTYTLAIMNATDGAARSIQFWGAMLNEGADVGGYVKTEASVGGSSPTPEYSGFGDEFVGVTAYYSLRQFTEAETLNAIRVRRSSDDTEQDIGFDANGDLDSTALTTFVNEDYNHYTSNWAADVDGWTVNNAGGGTVTLSNDTNRLKVDVSGMTTTALRPALNFPTTIWSNITEGCSVTITIEGANLVVDGLFVDGTFQNITDHDLDTGTFTYTFTKGASNTAIIYFNSTGKGDYVGFLESVVITQTTADGAVTTWYDQSGNGNDATNSTESEQPLIVDGGSVVTIDGYACLDGDLGAGDTMLQATNVIDSVGDVAIFSTYALKTDGTTANQITFEIGNGTSTHRIHDTLGRGGAGTFGIDIRGTSNYDFGNATGVAVDDIYLNSILSESNGFYINGTQQTSDNAVRSGSTVDALTLFNRGGGAFPYKGKLFEFIFFDSDQSSNRTGIETNINDHFDIYT